MVKGNRRQVPGYPDDEQMRVSPSIYQALDFEARRWLKREVKNSAALRARKDLPQAAQESRERPVVSGTRWEGATLVERTTRYLMLVRLPVDHPAESVHEGLIKTMGTCPPTGTARGIQHRH